MKWIGLNYVHIQPHPPFNKDILITDGNFINVAQLKRIVTTETKSMVFEFSGVNGNCSFATHWMEIPNLPEK